MDRSYLVLAIHNTTGICDYWWLENEEEMRERIKDIIRVDGEVTFAGKIDVDEDFTEEFASN